MQFDGSEIYVKDHVYDLVFGTGIVDRLLPEEGKLCVSFGANIRYYDLNGRSTFNAKTLYWRDPITVIPHKNDDAWDKTMKITQAVTDILGRKK